MNRRQLLAGLAGVIATGVAPAFIKKEVLMPTQKLWVPPQELTVSGWVHASGFKVGQSSWQMVEEEVPLLTGPLKDLSEVLTTVRSAYQALNPAEMQEMKAAMPKLHSVLRGEARFLPLKP